MPAFRPISWRKFVHYLRKAGFEGPEAGSKHLYMIKDGVTFTIPNPHRDDIRLDLLSDLLKQLGISRKEWERL